MLPRLILYNPCRLKFEEKQLAATEARLQTLRTSIEKETRNIENILQVKKSNLEDDIKQAESDLEKEQQVLSVLKEVFVELTKQVEDCRKAYINAVKTLDQAKKEIATFVSIVAVGKCCTDPDLLSAPVV